LRAGRVSARRYIPGRGAAIKGGGLQAVLSDGSDGPELPGKPQERCRVVPLRSFWFLPEGKAPAGREAGESRKKPEPPLLFGSVFRQPG